MKQKILIAVAVGFFLFVQFVYFWVSWRGVSFSLMLLLLSVFAMLTVVFLYKLLKAARSRFRHRGRNVMLITLGFVLAATAYRPYGLIDFESFIAPDVLVAVNKGKGCTQVLKLKPDNTFVRTYTCFSIDVDKGTYTKEGDTIYLSGHPENFNYGIIQHNYAIKSRSKLILYKFDDAHKQVDTLTFAITKFKQ